MNGASAPANSHNCKFRKNQPVSPARLSAAPLATASHALLTLLFLAGTLSTFPIPAPAQTTGVPELVEGAVSAPPSASKKKKKATPEKPESTPDISIPVEPLGFGPPASFYLGSRVAQLSVNFLDEDTLLFTFRVPGLVSREHPATGSQPDELPSTDPHHDERHIRALVLSLPTGKVIAESLWRLHDLSPYLRVLNDARFLLRDRNSVQIGDASLHLTPFLRFPGRITSIAVDPSEQLLVANSVEPAAAETSTDPSSLPLSASPIMLDNTKSSGTSQTLLRILRLNTRSVMLFSHTAGNVRLAIDGEGYYEPARASGNKWVITYDDFHGATIPILPVDSTCSPSIEVVTHSTVLASACNLQGGRILTMMTRDKHRLWEATTPPTQVWPILAESANGQRLARATLTVSHAIGPNYALDNSDIRGELVQVYDSATGKVVLNGPATPVLDGGGNFALSPSGKRFAVLNSGALQIFNLPQPPPLPPVSNTTPVTEAKTPAK